MQRPPHRLLLLLLLLHGCHSSARLPRLLLPDHLTPRRVQLVAQLPQLRPRDVQRFLARCVTLQQGSLRRRTRSGRLGTHTVQLRRARSQRAARLGCVGAGRRRVLRQDLHFPLELTGSLLGHDGAPARLLAHRLARSQVC